MLTRRSLFTGLAALVAAPAVIRTPGLLMPVRTIYDGSKWFDPYLMAVSCVQHEMGQSLYTGPDGRSYMLSDYNAPRVVVMSHAEAERRVRDYLAIPDREYPLSAFDPPADDMAVSDPHAEIRVKVGGRGYIVPKNAHLYVGRHFVA